MGYLLIALIGLAILVIAFVGLVVLTANKRKVEDKSRPDGRSYNRPQEEGGNVEQKPKPSPQR